MWLLGMLTIDLINSTLNCFQKKTKTIEFLSGIIGSDLPGGEGSRPSDISSCVSPARLREVRPVREDIGLFQSPVFYNKSVFCLVLTHWSSSPIQKSAGVPAALRVSRTPWKRG